jgi:hypothetical protein
MGNVIPVLINTDCLHELDGKQLLEDIRTLHHGRSREGSFLREDYYGAGPGAGRALSGRNGVKVGVYHHSSQSCLFMNEHTNFFQLSPTYCEWRAQDSVETAKKELERIKQAKRLLLDAEKQVKARLAELKAATG